MAAGRNEFLCFSAQKIISTFGKNTWTSQLIVSKVVDQRPGAGVPRNPWLRRIRMQFLMFQNMKFDKTRHTVDWHQLISSRRTELLFSLKKKKNTCHVKFSCQNQNFRGTELLPSSERDANLTYARRWPNLNYYFTEVWSEHLISYRNHKSSGIYKFTLYGSSRRL